MDKLYAKHIFPGPVPSELIIPYWGIVMQTLILRLKALQIIKTKLKAKINPKS